MKSITALLIGAMVLTIMPAFVYGQDNMDPQQHLKIQHFAKMHGIHSEKLKNIMRHMITSLMKQPKNKEDELQQQRYLAGLVKASRQVVSASRSLDKYIAAGELNEKETAKFKTLAEVLHNEAVTAESLAKAGNTEELKVSLGRFNQTCVTCHRLFRER